MYAPLRIVLPSRVAAVASILYSPASAGVQSSTAAPFASVVTVSVTTPVFFGRVTQ